MKMQSCAWLPGTALLALGSLAPLTPGAAEIPPLRPEVRKQQAAVIAVGTVQSLRQRAAAVGVPNYTDKHVTARVLVEHVVKGKGVLPRKVIRVHYWRAGKRPPGWTGPGGQYRDLKTGDRVQLFLTRAKTGEFDLLTPNGWEPAAVMGKRKTRE